MPTPNWFSVSFSVVLFVGAGSAAAQGIGRSLDLDLSVRSSGMGGASNAVLWGEDPNSWANPAMLGYHRGAEFHWAKTQLVPGLPADVFLESHRFAFAFAGLGIAHTDVDLDYGPSSAVDESGNPIGTFHSYEKIHTWSVGWSLSETMRTWAVLTGRAVPAIARHADVALGLAGKHLDMNLAPGTPGAQGSGTGLDEGLVVRISPWVSSADGPLPIGLDLAYGYSVLNANDERIEFFDSGYPLSRSHRNGLAARVALGIPAGMRSGASARTELWLASLDPLIAIGAAQDWEHNSAGGLTDFYDVQRFGLEIAFANILTLRAGHVTDRVGHIDGNTAGWGVGLHVGHVAGFRYDHAIIPQPEDSGLEDVRRNGFTAFVDLLPLLNPGLERSF